MQTMNIYKQRIALWTGKNENSSAFWTRWSWPLAGIQIYADKIVLRVLFKKIEIRKSEITDFETIPVRMGTGIRVRHNLASLKKVIVIGAPNLGQLLEKIKLYGYPVENETHGLFNL